MKQSQRFIYYFCLSLVFACADAESNTDPSTPSAGSPAAYPAGTPAGYPAGSPGASMAGIMLVQPTATGLQITSPQSGQIFTENTFEVKGVHPTASSIMVNGMPVDVINGAFSLMYTATQEGVQTISASDDRSQTMVSCFVDLTAPELKIDSPLYGTFVTYPNALQVQGTVFEYGSGIASVSVNGQPATVEPSGRFFASITPPVGLNKILVEAKDRAGKSASQKRAVMAGEFKNWQDGLSDAISLKITPPAFDVVEEALINQIENGLLNQVLPAPTEDFAINNLQFQSIGINFEPKDGYIDLEIRVNQLRVDATVSYGITVDGIVSVDPAVFTAKVYLSATPSGNLSVDVMNPYLDLQNLNIDLGNSLTNQLVNLVDGYIQDYINDSLSGLIEQYLVNELIQPELLNPTFNFLKYQTQLHIKLKEIQIVPAALTAKADILLDEISVYHQNPGYLYVQNPMPPAMPSEKVNLALPGNFFHYLFGHLWQGGLLDISLDQLLTDPPSVLKVSALNGFANGHLTEYMGADEFVQVSLRPMLPPTVRFSANDPSHLYIDAYDLFLDLQLSDGRAFATFALDVMGKVKPSILNGEFHLDLEVQSEVRFIDAPLFDVKGDLIVTLLQPLLDGLPALLGPGVLDNIFDLTQLELFGVQLRSAMVNSSPMPNPYLYLGVDISN